MHSSAATSADSSRHLAPNDRNAAELDRAARLWLRLAAGLWFGWLALAAWAAGRLALP